MHQQLEDVWARIVPGDIVASLVGEYDFHRALSGENRLPCCRASNQSVEAVQLRS